MKGKTALPLLVIGLMMVLFAGCTSLGPDSVVRDRFAYTTAVLDSWESQMLLNLVKARYGHAPVFLDVASVISQYSLQTQANVGATWQTPLIDRQGGNLNANTFSLGGSGSFTDRPTITYNPLTGEKFARSLMAPIPPVALLNLVQAGYRVDLLFRACVQAINGVQNSYGGPSNTHNADHEFYEILEKMRIMQASGDVGIKINKNEKNEKVSIVFRWKKGKSPGADSADIRKLLDLDPAETEFRVIYGAIPSNNREIALLTRSMLQIMLYISSTIEVPEEHVADKRVMATFREKTVDGAPINALVRIHSSYRRPDDAFVAIPFRDLWFWIDDKDVMSKNAFSFLMFIFTLTETGSKEGVPIVTIPAG